MPFCFFRLGDFYEMFFEDANVGAQLLNVALTKRGDIPMCGIPFHAANGYIARLLKAGRKVAICDQLEEARPGKWSNARSPRFSAPAPISTNDCWRRNGIISWRRSVRRGKIFGLALADLTTGDFKTTELEGEAALRAELERLRPAEIIYPAAAETLAALARRPASCVLNPYEDWVFAPETAEFTVREHFKVGVAGWVRVEGPPRRPSARRGRCMHYLTQHLRRDVSGPDAPVVLSMLRVHGAGRGVVAKPGNPGAAARWRAAPGLPLRRAQPHRHADGRAALARLAQPAPGRRRRRFSGGATRCSSGWRTARCWTISAANLAEVRDLERTMGRLSTGSGNARDLLALRMALEKIPALKKTSGPVCASPARAHGIARHRRRERVAGAPGLLDELAAQLAEAPDLVELIARAIVDEPPLAVKEGGLIRDGFDPRLDELRAAMRDGKDWIAKLQQDEIARTGIASLKVRFNSVFGYYIEVTKSNLDKVPAHYIRKQTIAGGERFITPELKEMEGKILGAEERSVKLEYELFQRVREQVLGQLPRLQQTAAALAPIGRAGGLRRNGAALQLLPAGNRRRKGVIEIREGRHPVLEQIAGRRTVCAQRRPPGPRRTANCCSSPARTWRARAPSSGRWR